MCYLYNYQFYVLYFHFRFVLNIYAWVFDSLWIQNTIFLKLPEHMIIVLLIICKHVW
jgi:hypothetical protein